MEQLHNLITATIVRYLKGDKVKVSEAVLVLEMIKQDLVSQVTNSAYLKKPVKIVKKEEVSGVRKNNTK